MDKKVKVPNYTDEQVATLRDEYLAGKEAGKSNAEVVAMIAEKLGKNTKSVTAKLVREGVYVAEPKAAKTPKDDGPNKKEVLAVISAFGFDIEGFETATKNALIRLRDFLATNPAKDAA